MTKIFYKYRGNSAFTDQIITTGKVFLATAHQLNDLFECSLQDLSREWVQEQIQLNIQSALAGFLMEAVRAKSEAKSFFGLRPYEIDGTLEEIRNAGDRDAVYDAMRAFIKRRTGAPPSDCRALLSRLDDQLVETGIFSLSTDPAHPLMWAHYGANHEGVCFGFAQADGSKLADPVHGRPVIYSDDLPAMNPNGLRTSLQVSVDERGRPRTSMKVAFDDDTFQRVVTTKPTCWSYEAEFRYIEPFSGACDWPGPLVECTFGRRCSDEQRQHYIDLLEANVRHPVALFEIIAKPGTNALTRRPLAQPQTEPDRDSRPAVEGCEPSNDAFLAKLDQLIQQEKYGEVIFQTDENLKHIPADPRLLHLKATALGFSQDHRVAYAIFKQLSRMYPEIAATHYGMGCALQGMGRLREARKAFERAYLLAPDDASIALNLGIYLIADPKRKTEGIACLERAERLGHRKARRLLDDARRTSEAD